MTLYDAHGNFIVGPVLPLATRKGQHIPNERRLQRPPASMIAARDIVLTHHPSARVRSLSSMYNCMGMAFASRRTYIESEHLELILDGDNYQRVPHESELAVGDIVIYRDQNGEPVHVAMVSDVRTNLRDATWEVFVISQWGGDGEYFHRVDDVHPRLGEPTEYWTDRI